MQAKVFEDNPLLPMWAVLAFLYVLPFVEAILGALTALGLFTRWALLAGSAMIFWLVFGNLTRQDWGTVGNNMHYVLYYSLMIAGCASIASRSIRCAHPLSLRDSHHAASPDAS